MLLHAVPYCFLPLRNIGIARNGPLSPFAQVPFQASSQLLPPLVLSVPVRLSLRFEKEISQLTSTFRRCCHFVWGTGWNNLLFCDSNQELLQF